jgi:uncharacterized protein (TIGR03086 family)
MVDVLDWHRKAAAEFGTRVEAIKDDQWHRPTPCSDWDVRTLVNHLVYDNRWAPDTVGGATIEEVGDRYDGDLLGDDPVGAWRDSIAEALRVFEEPGALDRTVHLSYGDEPAREYLDQRILDLAIHAWDLAQGINASDQLAPELVDYLWGEWQPRQRMIRQSGLFGDLVSATADADTETRLLALLGRRR